MGKLKNKLQDASHAAQDVMDKRFGSWNLSAVHLAFFFGLLGLIIIASIKVLSSRYFATLDGEIEVLDRVVTLMDEKITDTGTCSTTLKGAHNSYYPKRLRGIENTTGNIEFQVEQKPTNRFEFMKFTAQMLFREKERRSVLLTYMFKNLKSKKIYKYFKVLHIKLNKKKIKSCTIGQRLRL